MKVPFVRNRGHQATCRWALPLVFLGVQVFFGWGFNAYANPAIIITAGTQGVTYGTPLDLGTTNFAVTAGTLNDGEHVTAVVLSSNGGTNGTSPVGIYTITPSGATGTGWFDALNYDITYVTNTLTVSPLSVVLSGTRRYDGTATAAAGILTVTNTNGLDVVTVTSGSASLAGSLPGAQPITNASGLSDGNSR